MDINKIRCRGILGLYCGEPTRFVCISVYGEWKKRFIRGAIMVYASTRLAQTSASVPFPQWVPNYTKFDLYMIPFLAEAVSKGLAKTNYPVCLGIAAGLDAGSYLTYNSVYAYTLRYKLLYLAALEVAIFGETVFVHASPAHQNHYLQQAFSIMSLVNSVIRFVQSPHEVLPALRAQLEIRRARAVLENAVFQPNTLKERLIRTSRVVMGESLGSSLGPRYRTGVAVCRALDILGF